jgi:hypothetical protein
MKLLKNGPDKDIKKVFPVENKYFNLSLENTFFLH